MQLTFTSIKNGTIFESDFQTLTSDVGTIRFKHMGNRGGIAVVYAPNGTGKSSLTKVLSAEASSGDVFFAATDENGNKIAPESKAFHIIPDQIGRNVVRGKETDYLVGQQIRREYELRDRINIAFKSAFDSLNNKYKTDFKVSKVGDYLLTQIGALRKEPYPQAFRYLRSIVNIREHGKNIDRGEFVAFISEVSNRPNLIELDTDKRIFVINDLAGRVKIVKTLIELDPNTIIANGDIAQIEQNDDAICILKKYHNLHSCVVCDNENFDVSDLLTRKQKNRQRIYDGLDDRTKKLLDKVVRNEELTTSDPFEIKQIVNNFIAGGDADELLKLQSILNTYIHVVEDEMINCLFHCFDGTELFRDFNEYMTLTQIQPVLDSEELLYIEDVINENIGKDITIERDEESKNYKLKLGEKDLIGTDRGDMELSSGEQNFISLAFELLLARHSDKDYIVIDDPISSFDSVYKNKIAYCIIKFLEQKKQIVLTHNTDLVRLLNVQLNNCFNLYILNNVENGHNGFVSVSDREKNLLINLHELAKFFQNRDELLSSSIKNRRQFLMAMIPFIRGYAHISLDPNDNFGTISKIMHGYSNEGLDIVPIYKEMFGYDFEESEFISVDDILGIDTESLEILDKTQFPLLSDTLEQTLIYYHLRMKVEKVLVDEFHLMPHDTDTLNQIIQKALCCGNNDPNFEKKRSLRVFFTSRKTLLNEFNHFEGNMNIFQPAIDITRAALQKEVSDIEDKLKEVIAFARSGADGIQQ